VGRRDIHAYLFGFDGVGKGRYLFFLEGLAWSPDPMPPFPDDMAKVYLSVCLHASEDGPGLLDCNRCLMEREMDCLIQGEKEMMKIAVLNTICFFESELGWSVC
jgi:hypothetical protein